MRNLAIALLFASPDTLQAIAKGKAPVDVLIVFTNMVLFYTYMVFHNRILFDKLWRKRQYLAYVFSFLATIFIWREGTSYVEWLFLKAPGETYQVHELKVYNWVFWVFCYWADIVYIYIALGIYLAYTYFREREEVLNLLYLKRELELKQLKEQLNPHFLFNALNNIYSYSLESSEYTGELILKLSELMRFILINATKDKIPLMEEVAFMEHYIAFEKERLGKRCIVTFTKNIEETNILVAPFILFTFLENAFKHGTNFIAQGNIEVYLHTRESSLEFSTTNTINKKEASQTQTGLANARRRLDILYPERHTLTIRETQDVFTVSLFLQTVHETEMHYN